MRVPVQILIIWKAYDMDGDQADSIGGTPIQQVQEQDEADVNVEHSPETRTKENIEDESSIDQEAKWTQNDMSVSYTHMTLPTKRIV